MGTQHQTLFCDFRRVGILLVFLVGFGSCIHDSAYSNEMPRSESDINSNKYILKSYFEKHESFVESKYQDFITDELPSYSLKQLPDDLHTLLQISVSKRLLIGEGSHRHLNSDIRICSQSDSISKLSDHYCKVIIVERLPVGVFADPFELQHLLHRGVFADIAVFGDTNLELPSFVSNRTIVEIHMNVSSKIFSGQKNELEVGIVLPLHARYPPLGENGYEEIEIGRPDLFMECGQEGNLSSQSYLFTPNSGQGVMQTDGVKWRIPSGRRSHAGFVSIVTFVAAFISTLVIVVVSLFYSSS